MKKITAITLAMLCVFALCACGGGETNKPEETAAQSEYVADYGELYFESNGVKFGIFDEAEPVINALGEPVNGTFESDSCAYQGKDYFYYYDGFELMANELNGVKKITGITLADDTVKIPQGVTVGMKLDDALSLMGDGSTQNGDVYKFVTGTTQLRLRVGEDGTLAAVEYSAANA